MDINKLIFSRTAPAKKIEIVETLNQAELLSITPESARRIIREVGSTKYKSRDKELRIFREYRTGNDWNSEFTGVCTYKAKLYVDLYLQYGNTDTDVSEPFDKFFAHGEYRGSIIRNDSHGNPQTHYFTYTPANKANCMKSLLLQYLRIKYKERLSEK